MDAPAFSADQVDYLVRRAKERARIFRADGPMGLGLVQPGGDGPGAKHFDLYMFTFVHDPLPQLLGVPVGNLESDIYLQFEAAVAATDFERQFVADCIRNVNIGALMEGRYGKTAFWRALVAMFVAILRSFEVDMRPDTAGC